MIKTEIVRTIGKRLGLKPDNSPYWLFTAMDTERNKYCEIVCEKCPDGEYLETLISWAKTHLVDAIH